MSPRTFWTWPLVDNAVAKIIETYHCIPPSDVLCKNGYGGLIKWLRKQSVSMSQLRGRYEAQHTVSHLRARNGIKYRSYAEVFFANFLFARAITFKDGENYPEEYNTLSGRHHGVYDFHFTACCLPFSGQTVDVEIFGAATCGDEQAQSRYKVTREAKELYNKNNVNFLALEFTDCYEEDKLKAKLLPYIGHRDIVNAIHPRDAQIPSTLWSLADEVLLEAQQIAQHFDGILPAQHWFDRTTKPYENRKIQDWEKSNWSVFLGKVRRLGGLNHVRTLMGQADANRHDWTRNEVVGVFADCYEKYLQTPASVSKTLSIKGAAMTPDERNDYKRLNGAMGASKRVSLFAGGYRQACTEAGIVIACRPKTRS